jgi:nucleotide-binding universal stress UspA family protein
MKKIIAAFDGLKYSESTAFYAIEIAKKYNGKIFGIFLEDFTYHSYSITDLARDDYPEQHAAQLNRMDADMRESSIRHFTQQCEENGLIYSVHRDKNIAIRELLHESRFADVIIIQSNETLNHYSEKAPTGFIENLLERTECPVLVVPPVFQKIEKVIFLYDGKPSSVFAIKQFSYLLPAQEGLPVELLCVKHDTDDDRVPDGRYLREWLKLYYNDVSMGTLTGNSHEEILRFLKEQIANCVVVLGAYERGSISRMIHHSLADDIIRQVNLPLFISHR